MNNRVLTRLHALTGMLAWITLLSSFLTTIIVEMAAAPAAVILLKSSIVYGLPVLAVFMTLMGISGHLLSRGRETEPHIARNQKRTALSGIIAVVFLVPSAIILRQLAISGGYPGTAFFLIQTLELGMGALAIFLVGSMLRESFQLTEKFQTKKVA